MATSLAGNSAPREGSTAVVINPDCQGLVVPDSKTGFISGTYSSLPTTVPSGSLCVYKWDGNGGSASSAGTGSSWPANNAFFVSSPYTNTDASLFEGSVASCETGYRLPSVVELKAIVDYFNSNFGGWTAPNGSSTYATWYPLQAAGYWSSTYQRPAPMDMGATAWIVNFGNGNTTAETSSSLNNRVRCVKDL